MIAHCRGGDIVHAGTYFGDFLPGLSRELDPGCMLWAFEPNPENYRCARVTALLNGLDNLELRQAALGEALAQARLHILDDKGRALGGASHLAEGDCPGIGEEAILAVDVLAIDRLIPSERVVRIIQLDVERQERAALAGALETIRRCRPILILENVPDGDWFDGNILALGYRLETKLHRNSVFSVADA